MRSVVMGALACGYVLGGRLAGRTRPELFLYGAIFLSALYQTFILFSVRSLLPPLAEQGDFAGVFVATLLIFAPTMAALAATGPLVVQLCSQTTSVRSPPGKTDWLSTIPSTSIALSTTFIPT